MAPEASITTYESAHLSAPTKSKYTLDKAYVPYIANMKYTWKSSDTSVATVDSKGVVSILRYGKITLTGTGTDGSTIKVPLDAKFWDVDGSNVKGASNYQYFYDPVYWAAENGITTGYDRVYFGPSKNCLREAIVTFLYRYSKIAK